MSTITFDREDVFSDRSVFNVQCSIAMSRLGVSRERLVKDARRKIGDSSVEGVEQLM